MNGFTESEIESLAIDVLKANKYAWAFGPSISPDSENTGSVLHGTRQEAAGDRRDNYHDVILKLALERAIVRLNPHLPASAQSEASQKVISIHPQDLLAANEAFHKFLVGGVPVVVNAAGHERGEKAWLVDYLNVENNDFLAVNQFTVIENNQNKRADIILFVNGMPLARISHTFD